MRRILLVLVLLFLGGCTLAGLYRHCFRAAVPEDIAGWRAAARGVPHAASVDVVSDDGELDPVVRYRLISVNWEICPRVARVVTPASVGADYLISSAYLRDGQRRLLSEAGYVPQQSNTFAWVWGRRGADPAAVAAVPVRAAQCPFGGLRPPNGLGVYAGKAKLFIRNRGVPEGFWTDPTYAIYQPSYPPGMTVLAVLAFAMTGVADSGLVGCLVPAALLGIFLLLTARARDPLAYALALLYVLCPWALRMGAGFYAEPLAALCLIAGARLLRTGHARLGWWVVGCAALFRHEALLLAGLMWCGDDTHSRGSGYAALLPGVAWQMFAWSVGARVYDYDFTSCPNGAHLWEALKATLHLLTAGAGAIGGGLLPLALGKGWRGLRVCLEPLVFLGACVFLLGFNTSGHFSWIVDGTMPRVAWLSMSVALGRALHF